MEDPSNSSIRVYASQRLVNFDPADERVVRYRRERYCAQADDMKYRRPELVGSSYRISRPAAEGWLTAPLVKATTIWPLLLAVAVNVLTTAMYSPPAAA